MLREKLNENLGLEFEVKSKESSLFGHTLSVIYTNTDKEYIECFDKTIRTVVSFCKEDFLRLA